MAEYFVNPYTFVSLRDGKTINTVSPGDKKISGKIVCTLTAKTQLAIPDLKNGTTPEGINKHPFFRVGGKAVIPGSSIRGVIRNVYEALTNSCMHINDKDDDYFSSRQNKEKVGLLAYEDKTFKLYEAERLRAMQYKDDLKTGDTVSYEVASSDDEDRSVYKKAMYKKAMNVRKSDSGDGIFLRVDTFGKPPKQNHPSVFIRKGKSFTVSPKEITAFSVNIDRYNKNLKQTKNKHIAEQYKNCFEAMKNGKALLPVWYCIKNGYHYLAPSQFSRTIFISKPKEMLEKMGYSACVSKKDMCKACALFGMLSNERGSTVASHVRFGDAVCEDNECYDGYYVLPVLGSPKLSSFEFYLKNKYGKYVFENNMIVPIDPDEDGTVLAGRKFYWHHKGKKMTDDQNAIDIAVKAKQEHKDNFSSKDNCLELVKSGSEFSFEVYFDSITEEQLKKLVYSLNFGDNDKKSRLCHKIGHGKPVGLGSVKICVESILSRDFENGVYTLDDVTNEYVSPKAEELFDSREYEQVIKAVCMDTIEDRNLISYPRTTKSEQAFSWFAKNRETMRSKGMPKIYNRLPDITDPDQTLPVIDEQGDFGGSKNFFSGRNKANKYPHKKNK